AASALAALDDYGTAAFGFAAGAVAGLVVIAAFVDHGVRAFGWGLALNGAISLAVPLVLLVRRGGIGLPTGQVAVRLRRLVEGVARWALGPAYGGGTGSQLGRLVVYLAPWMVASVAVSVAFPLLFVRGSARFLPLLAVGVLALHVLVEWGGRAAFGLAGIAAG